WLGSHRLPGRRVGVATVKAEGDPSRLFTQLDACRLLWRHCRGIEHMDTAVRRIAQPNFLLIGCQADAMTGAAVAFDWALGNSLDLHAVQLLAGLQVANLKSE